MNRNDDSGRGRRQRRVKTPAPQFRAPPATHEQTEATPACRGAAIGLFLLIALLLYGCQSEGKKAMGRTEGCIIGYSAAGVFVLSLPDGKQSTLISSGDGHDYASPVYDSASQTLYCIDKSTSTVIAAQAGLPISRLYEIATGYDLISSGLLLDPTGEKLYIVLFEKLFHPRSSELESVCVVYDTVSRTVAGTRPTVRPTAPWLDESRILTVQQESTDGEDVVSVFLAWDIVKGKSERLFALEDTDVLTYTLSPDRRRLCVRTSSEFRLYELPEGRLLETLADHQLPGRFANNGNICLVSQKHLVVPRSYSALRSAGTLLVDLTNGSYTRLVEGGILKGGMLFKMQYLPQPPQW